MARINFDATAPRIVGMTAADDFGYTITELPTGAAGGSVTTTDRDVTYTVTTVTQPNPEFSVAAYPLDSAVGVQPTINTTTPEVCAVSPSGRVSRVGDGVATVLLSNPYGTRQITRNMSPGQPVHTAIIDSYAVGSITRYLLGKISGYVAGQSLSDPSSQIYTGWVDQGTLAPNQSRIAPDVDLSWLEVSHGPSTVSQGYYAGPCSLITPRHALVAWHYHADPGSVCTFRRRDGTLQMVTILAAYSLGNDVGIYYFDAPVTGCDFVKLLSRAALKTKASRLYPAFLTGAPDESMGYGLTAFSALFNSMPQQGLSARRKLTVTVVCSSAGDDAGALFSMQVPAQHPLYAWAAGEIRGNDSGSPVFLPLVEAGNSAPTCVLLTQHWTVTTGPDLGGVIGQINAAMNANKASNDATVYSVGIADISAFSNF